MSQYLFRKGVSFVRLANAPVNALSLSVREGILKGLESAHKDKADFVVLTGAGRAFCAGADISEFATGRGNTSPTLREVIQTLDEYEKPLIAYVNGTALGGGLEVALGCHWRIAAPSASAGLPEVHLGILPGAGGTQRLPRLVGMLPGIELMTSGRVLKSTEALACGVFDEVLSTPEATSSSSSPDTILDCIVQHIHSSGGKFNAPLAERRVSNMPLLQPDNAALEAALAKVTRDARGQVAPGTIYRAVVEGGRMGSFQKGLQQEGELFQELAAGPQAKALQHFFFAERKVSTPPKVKTSGEGGTGSVLPKTPSVGVVGGGTMGAGIAMSFANAKMPVTIVETSEELAAAAVERIRNTYKASSAFKSGKMSPEDLDALMGRITPAAHLTALSSADIVVEAVFENLAVKRDIFKTLDRVCKPSAVLASNTSCLDVDKIAAATTRPQQVVGTHFFSPANVMKLLEVVRGKDTSVPTIAATMELGKRIGKTSVVAGNCYGFIGNRMLEPYGREAVFLIEEGASPAQVDKALKSKVGLAMGFFEMMDLAGGDVGWRQRIERKLTGPDATDPTNSQGDDKESDADKSAHRAPDFQGMRYSTLPDTLAEGGAFGQKTGRGWYKYDPSNPRKAVQSAETDAIIAAHRERADSSLAGSPFKVRSAADISDDEIIERCMYSLVNEGYRILGEGIASSTADIDVVYVYGYGFPRYRGGPMWWAEHEVGLRNVVAALERHAEAHPNQPWLEPCATLKKAAAAEAAKAATTA